MTFNRSEVASGAIFIGIGLLFGISTLLNLEIGTARRMGPGFFPLALSGLLVVLGLVIALRPAAAAAAEAEEPRPPIPWRGLIILLAVPVFFGATVRGLGLVPSVAISVFAAAFASRKTTVPYALLLSVVLTLFCLGVFYFGLGIAVRPFGSWTEAGLEALGLSSR